MESLFDIIEYVPTSPIAIPEWPKESLGVTNEDGFYMYFKKDWTDITAVKKDWYTKAEYISYYWMCEGVDNYIAKPSADFDIGKIITAGKERSTKFITMTKNAWKSDLFEDLKNRNQPTDIDQNFLKDLHIKNMRAFVWKILSKKS